MPNGAGTEKDIWLALDDMRGVEADTRTRVAVLEKTHHDSPCKELDTIRSWLRGILATVVVTLGTTIVTLIVVLVTRS